MCLQIVDKHALTWCGSEHFSKWCFAYLSCTYYA